MGATSPAALLGRSLENLLLRKFFMRASLRLRPTLFLTALALLIQALPIQADENATLKLASVRNWDIVVAADAIATDAYAAKEFQSLFKQASGVELPIRHEAATPTGHVFIGLSPALQAHYPEFSVDDLGPEDLRILITDQAIILAGGPPRGTLYGVYSFLEDEMGIRFLTPDHTHVPSLTPATELQLSDRTYRPPFANYRNIGFSVSTQPVFGIRHRINAFWDDKTFGFGTPFASRHLLIGHSLYRQVSIDEYGESHPEYFALWDGKRSIHFHTHYCLTNPELVPIITKALLGEIEHWHPKGRLNYAISQNDTIWQYCQCDNCQKLAKANDSNMAPLLLAVNAVADIVAEQYPDAIVGSLAYGFTRKPPTHMRARPNVAINLSNIEACQLHAYDDPACPTNVAYHKDLLGWQDKTDHRLAWLYGFNFNDELEPYPNLHALPPLIKKLAELNYEGLFVQAEDFAGAEMNFLRFYLFSRIAWNPQLDVDQVINEFLDLHYGPSAPFVRQYLELTENYYRANNIHHASCIKAMWDLPIDKEVAWKSLIIFKRAYQAAPDEVIRKRVDLAALAAYRAVLEPAIRLTEGQKLDTATAKKLRPVALDFRQKCTAYGVTKYFDRVKPQLETALGPFPPM
jgi:hypothetical protein